MKVECSCGAKYEFELRPEMREHPVSFVCPACGLDASAFVDGLVREELGQTCGPSGGTVPALLSPGDSTPDQAITDRGFKPAAQAGLRLHQPSAKPEPLPVGLVENLPTCPKHPGQVAAEKCYICSKPICPKCMQLFGYVCSPLCKAKAESHGITVPIYERQKSMVEARFWRKVVWLSAAGGGVLAVILA